ncbi:zf-HC2 domain-containing protein [Streptomyces sp. NPDC047002]|uniref:zf-HC2 domain-containing protein n=1 Tax=Streptomyces sp. NPDC047002 TaxID=3155475 RepID=UPI0034560519
MRTSGNPHHDAASYALGVLDPGDAYRFEDHLMECPHCSFEVTGFGAVRGQLDAYVRGTPPGVPPFAAPAGSVLRGVLDAVAADRRTGTRRRAALAAAAAVLVAGAPLGVLAGSGGPWHAPAHWSAADPATGTSARVTAAARAWGSQISFELRGREVRGPCALVAVGRDGSRETVTTWSGTDGHTTLITAGGAALPPGGIDHFEVRAPGGRTLVTLGG